MRKLLSTTMLLLLFSAACGGGSEGTGGAGGTGAGGKATGGSGGSGLGGSAPLTLQTDKGAVTGVLQGTTRAFLGIPYAAPPTGDLRWKPPAPAAAWSDTLDATKKGPACAQAKALTGGFDTNSSEDCLTINVWAPERPGAGKLPVMVWIHGGGFVLGSGGDRDYDGQILSENTGKIVVSLNYRLGALGYLATPELKAEDASHPSSGAYGIEDQRAAMAWVKANIAAFGGDPGNVTIFGESAGGMSVCMHLASPKSKGLFERAIIESGPCDRVTSEAGAFTQGADFVAAVGCKGAPDVLACIRGKTAAEVIDALPQSNDFILGGGASWFPVVDGYNLPDTPMKQLEAGAFEKVPVILGSNADEGMLFFVLANTKVPDDAALAAFAEQLVPGQGQEIASRYPSSSYEGSAFKAAAAAVGDAGFICPTRRAARFITKAGGEAYLYHFTYPPFGALLGGLGAFHSAEVKYVFGQPTQLLPQQLSDEEITLSKAIQGHWSAFAAAGKPDGKSSPAWPKYDAASDQNLKLDVTIVAEAGLKKPICDFWDGVAIKLP